MLTRTSKSESAKGGSAKHKAYQFPHPPSARQSVGFTNGGTATLFRKSSCSCGGGCPSCKTDSNLKVSNPNDAAELEADRVADRVIRAADPPPADAGPTLPTKSDTNLRPTIQPKLNSWTGATTIHRDIGDRITTSHGKGFALDPGTRGFMESRFAMDLGGVRVHNGPDAAALSRELSARAFTFGSDIYFAEGQYRPETESGKHLLAHELAHVGQGGSMIHRCADKKDETTYDGKIAEIKAHPKYVALDPDPKMTADTIMTEGRDKADCLYYSKWLEILFTTEEAAGAAIGTEHRERTEKAATEEVERLKTDEAKGKLNVEEELTADPEPEPAPDAAPDKKPDQPKPKKPARNWTEYPGKFGGGIYKVDATDMTNIFVKVKISMKPTGAGTWGDVDRIRGLEDAIEKHASRKGFTMNIEFVNPDNKDDFVPEPGTFKVDVDPNTWTVASNWAGGEARTYAHELYHMLNFPIDRYNYIEDHARNKQMLIPRRLVWFLAEMHKPQGYNNPESLMAKGQYPIEEDICTIAQLDVPTCIKAREKLFPPPPPSLKLRTPMGFVLPTLGVGSFGGTAMGFAGWGYDLGIPLTHDADWRLFIGAHGTLLAQLEGDKRLAFLLGARIGIEKTWSTPKSGGPVLGAFGEGGAAFVQDKESADASKKFLPGAYGYGGVNLGYRWPAQDLTVDAEFGGGITSELGLHDPRTFVRDPEMVPFVTMGIRATFMFGGP